MPDKRMKKKSLVGWTSPHWKLEWELFPTIGLPKNRSFKHTTHYPITNRRKKKIDCIKKVRITIKEIK